MMIERNPSHISNSWDIGCRFLKFRFEFGVRVRQERGEGRDVRRGVVAATDFELFSISLHFPHFENIVCTRAGEHRLAKNTFFFQKSQQIIILQFKERD